MALELTIMLPDSQARTVPLDQSRLIIGSLPSNQLILMAPGVELIHALLERLDTDKWAVTDLGSEAGIKVNDRSVEVETEVGAGDRIQVGTVVLTMVEKAPPPPLPPPPPTPLSLGDAAANTPIPPTANMLESQQSSKPRRRSPVDLLFAPRAAKARGDVLEVVAYWGDTVLDIEHFHPNLPGFKKVTIGDPEHACMLAAAPKAAKTHLLASVSETSYTIRLASGMSARLRRSGGAENVESGKHRMGHRDIAHITYGPIKYFLMFTNPPDLRLPKRGARDPFFLTILMIALLTYAFFMSYVATTEVPIKDKFEDDLWAIVHVPERKKPKKKPEIKIAKVVKKPPPRPNPPKPKPKPVKPVKAKVVKKIPKPKPAKVVVAPKKREKKTHVTLTKPRTKAVKAPVAPRRVKKSAARVGKAKNSGGGRKAQSGGVRKGRSKSSIKGVAGVKNKKASGVNLGKLGLGVGAIKSVGGVGAIHTNFKSSAGGAGGGQGSGAKTYGIGGLGSGATLALSGSGSTSKNWGSGQNVVGSSKGIGKSFGGDRSATKVNVKAGDPLVSGGLGGQEIVLIIRKNLNPIRHCYDRLLQRSPSSSGKVKVKFTIGLNGRVSAATVVSATISDRTMQNCVTSQVKRWKFPKPRGGSPVTVNYPFAFSPL